MVSSIPGQKIYQHFSNVLQGFVLKKKGNEHFSLVELIWGVPSGVLIRLLKNLLERGHDNILH